MATVALSDGSTTVTLSGETTILGCTYFPQAAAPAAVLNQADLYVVERRTATERCDVVLEGTAANILAKVATVERLIEQAERRQRTGVGVKVFVQYTSDGDGSAWRSELLAGQVLWPEEPGRRMLWPTLATVEVGIAWTRRAFWEGARTQLELSTSKDTTPATSERRLYANDDATATDTNYVNIASTQVTGSIPAPLELRLVQAEVSAIGWRDFFVSNTVFCDPATFDPFLLKAEENLYSGAKSWTGGVDFDLFWDISAAQLADCAGQMMRILVAFNSLTVPCWIQPVVVAYVDPVPAGLYVDVAKGGEVYVSGGELINLGAVPIPPAGYDTAAGATALVLRFRVSGSGTADVDFVQLTPAGQGLFRHVEVLGYTWAQDEALVDNGTEGLLYVDEVGTGYHQPVARGYHEPVHVWPGRQNRLRVLCDDSSGWTAGRALKVQAWYRPRRLAV